MNLTVSGHHVEVTPAIREYITSKLQRVIRHFDGIIDVHVIISVEKLLQKVEATLHVRGNDLFAEASATDLYAAIDMFVDKLDRQLLRHKEKLMEKRHVSARGGWKQGSEEGVGVIENAAEISQDPTKAPEQTAYKASESH